MSEYENHTAAPRPKLTSYDELYPGRFMKAGELLGKKPTLTITEIFHEELPDSNGAPKLKVIISFKETKKMLVACKTNGLCIKHMFGKTLADWVGKRITLFAGQWNGEECVRIWGSPDIAEEMPVKIELPRKRPIPMVMHKTSPKGASAAAPTTQREPGGEG